MIIPDLNLSVFSYSPEINNDNGQHSCILTHEFA